MLDAFASVGATRFDVTWTTRSGDKDGFRRSVSLPILRRTHARDARCRDHQSSAM